MESSSLGVWTVLLGFVLVVLGQKAAEIVYNIYFHPLRKFPGLLSHSVSRWPWVLKLWGGRLPYHLVELHDKYGEVVRIAPDELSVIHKSAWRDIYGHQVGPNAGAEIEKNPNFYILHPSMPRSITNADRDQHTMMRRALSHGFSDKSMRDQETIIRGYVDLLIRRLNEKQQSIDRDGKSKRLALNMADWYNWTTFDIIGDLAMGNSFHCLEESAYHPWVKIIADAPKEISYPVGLRTLGFNMLLGVLIRLGIRKRKKILQYITEQLNKREKLGSGRHDLIYGLLEMKAEGELDFETLQAVCATIITAGSETTATVLSGVTYLLLKHPDKLATLAKEIRSTFKDEDEITFSSVQHLPYMLACLNEALRLYPPVSAGLPRRISAGDAIVAGQVLPEGTVLAVPQYAMYHSSRHWKRPEEYHPERFLRDPEFADDHLDTLQPFSVGPRNCIGRNLAYAEMRLILARIVFHFDMELADDSNTWMEGQKAYFLWKKPPLNVFLTPIH